MFQNNKFGNASGQTTLEADWTVKFEWTSTVFDDLLWDVTRTKTVGTRATLNDVENTVDFTTSATLTDYVFLNYQLSHKWKIGSVISPHIHWEQASNTTPNWLFQYRWQMNWQPKTTGWTNYIAITNAFTYVSGTLNQISHWAGITPPVGASLSDVIEIRIIRDSANATGLFPWANLYPWTASITSADIHYEIDTVGSRTEFTK